MLVPHETTLPTTSNPCSTQELARRGIPPGNGSAFGATRVFEYLRKGEFNQYDYREPSLAPTNPANRALDWETDIISTFRNYKGMDRAVGERDTPAGRLLYMARPLRADESSME